MTEPQVSVVIVNYNSGPSLDACLRALLHDDSNLECIVVDNASSDNSLDCMNEDTFANRVKLLQNTSNLGFSSAVNLGATHSRGEHLLVLNPDCVVYPNAVETLRFTFKLESTGIAGGVVLNTDGTEQRGCRRREPSPERIIKRIVYPVSKRFGKVDNGIDLNATALPAEPVCVDAVSGAFFMIPKTLFDSLGGMDEAYFLHFEDLDICRRVRDAGFLVRFHPDAVCVHYQSASGGAESSVVEKHKHNGLVRYLERFYHGKVTAFQWAVIKSAMVLRTISLRARNIFRVIFKRQDSLVHDNGTDVRQRMVDLERFIFNDLPVIVVTGATSQVGDYLIERFSNHAVRVLAVTRGSKAGKIHGDIWWVRPDRLPHLIPPDKCYAWIHLAPIWIISEFEIAIGRIVPRRLVALSSSSIASKEHSEGSKDRHTVAHLKTGENTALDIGRKIDTPVTIFRPTLIYGNENNKNVASIASLVRRLRFFPLVGRGNGLRAPVHADDVADSCIKVLDRPQTYGKVYYLAGGQTLEYREMVRRIFTAVQVTPRFFKVPRVVLEKMLAALSRLPRFAELTPQMLDRVNQDLVFDSAEAVRDFGYSPRDFEPEFDKTDPDNCRGGP
ncbi:MAG: hypothetical protein DHS20C01_15690 [marine bacterium B5-7]|nr:MAG: hypothetical protein DHS20C01_15690 [marine bacterium B5-7]